MANCLVMLACAGRGLSNSEEFVQSEEEEEEDRSTNDMNGNGGASWSSDAMEDEQGDVTGLKNSDENQQQHKQHISMASHHLRGTGNGGSTVGTMMGSSTGNGGFSTMLVDDSSLCGGGNGGGELLDHEFETSGGSASGVRMKYECSTCKRIFKSHQALGGHRASHKKVKGCFARTNLGGPESAEEEVMDEEQLPMDSHQHHHHPLPITSAMVTHLPSLETGKDELGDTTFNSSRKFIKGHECSICHRVFTSGQALGGHKRCHWGGTERVLDSSTNYVTVSKPGGSSLYFGQAGGSSGAGSFSMSRTGSVVKEEFLDLNLPAPVEDEEEEDGEEDDAKINNKDNRNNNNRPNNDMEMLYKLPQLVPASALKRNAGAMSSFNAYLDIYKSYLVMRKVVAERQQQQPQQQQHLDKMVSGGIDKVEFRCFTCEVCKCVFTSTESLNAHHNTQHTAVMISGPTPISAS